MEKFVYYDLAFLFLFCVALGLFLYRNRKNIQREGPLLLYRTKIGLDAIDSLGKKHRKFFSFLSTFIVAVGYLMAIAGTIFFFLAVYLTLTAPSLPKIPPVIPLFPYIDRALPTGFLPPFYFTYWIIVIAVVAVFHEFAHGVFAKIRDIRIKSTGFGFLGPLLAAFVELDEKQMAKKPIKSQLAVIAAGSFANLVLWVIFLIISGVFFSSFFVPNGVIFSGYVAEPVNLSAIDSVNGILFDKTGPTLSQFSSAIEKVNESIIEVHANGKTYFVEKGRAEKLKESFEKGDFNEEKIESVALLMDSPAYKANLSGAIQKISSEGFKIKITDPNSLREALAQFNPKDKVNVETTSGNYSLTLGENPGDKTKAFLGVSLIQLADDRLLLTKAFRSSNPSVYYSPKGDDGMGSLIIFIKNLLFWLTAINLFVMLFNMLPLGIVDGGRFFFLTMLAITKSEKKAMKAFRFVTYIIALAFIWLMVGWVFKAF